MKLQFTYYYEQEDIIVVDNCASFVYNKSTKIK